MNRRLIRTIDVAIDNDLGSSASDFQPAGIHRGQLTRQALQEFNVVEPRQPDLSRNIDP